MSVGRGKGEAEGRGPHPSGPRAQVKAAQREGMCEHRPGRAPPRAAVSERPAAAPLRRRVRRRSRATARATPFASLRARTMAPAGARSAPAAPLAASAPPRAHAVCRPPACSAMYAHRRSHAVVSRRRPDLNIHQTGGARATRRSCRAPRGRQAGGGGSCGGALAERECVCLCVLCRGWAGGPISSPWRRCARRGAPRGWLLLLRRRRRRRRGRRPGGRQGLDPKPPLCPLASSSCCCGAMRPRARGQCRRRPRCCERPCRPSQLRYQPREPAERRARR